MFWERAKEGLPCVVALCDGVHKSPAWGYNTGNNRPANLVVALDKHYSVTGRSFWFTQDLDAPIK